MKPHITICKYRLSLRPHLPQGHPGHQCVESFCSGYSNCKQQAWQTLLDPRSPE